MKVSKTRSGTAAPAKKNTKVAPVNGPAFAQHLEEAKKSDVEVKPVGEVSGVAAVSSILAVQEIGEDDQGRARQQLQKYGENVLDRLDEIQRDLLAGAIPKDRLANLAQLLRAKKTAVDDPALRKIIDDIELRAEVELAKLTRNI